MNDAFSWFAVLAGGFLVTIEMVSFACAVTIVISAGLAFARIGPSPLWRLASLLYIDVFRSIPLLALLIFFYYVLGRYTNWLGLSPFTLAVFGLALNEAAYLTEVYVAALKAVPSGQWLGGTSLGLSWTRTLRLVIIPQVLTPAVPITLNSVVQLIKNSALASLVAVNEVTMTATILVSQTFRPLEIYAILAIMYVTLIVSVSAISAQVERAAVRRSSFGTDSLTISAAKIRGL